MHKKNSDRDPPALRRSKGFPREAGQKGDCEFTCVAHKEQRELP